MKKILVVDDEAFFLQGFGRALQTDDRDVTVADTGSSALREIESAPYDVCFLDVCLPDIDGIELLQRIKEISPRTKIIMMTAGVVSTPMQDSIERHAHMFLTKPFDLLQVKMLTNSLLEGAVAQGL